MSRLIVAIPAYNEERTIGQVIEQIKKCICSELEAYILIVDDGSSDRTIEFAKEAGADIIVSHGSNQGVCCAYNSCIKYALKYNADIICTIDADAQFNPAEIRKVVMPIKSSSSDLVIGSRFVDSSNLHCVPILHTITNKIMAFLISLLVGTRLHDVESGFRAISAKAASSLNLLGKGSFSHDMILDLASKRFKITEIAVGVRYYKNRSSRVVSGLLKYGIVSLWSIFLKTLSIYNFYKSSSNNLVAASIVHVAPNLR